MLLPQEHKLKKSIWKMDSDMPGSLRLPPELEAEIKRLAKKHDRSKNSELIVAVRQYINRCADEEASEHENDLSCESTRKDFFK